MKLESVVVLTLIQLYPSRLKYRLRLVASFSSHSHKSLSKNDCVLLEPLKLVAVFHSV